MNNQEDYPIDHDRIKQLVAHEAEDENGWDDGFHENAAQIIEQLLLELSEATIRAPQMTESTWPLSDKERVTVQQDRWFALGPYAKHHQNWIKRFEVTVLNREEMIQQLKDPCPDCEKGVAKNPGGAPVRCRKCDGSGRLIVNLALDARMQDNEHLQRTVNQLESRLFRVNRTLRESGFKVVEDDDGQLAVQLCKTEVGDKR